MWKGRSWGRERWWRTVFFGSDHQTHRKHFHATFRFWIEVFNLGYIVIMAYFQKRDASNHKYKVPFKIRPANNLSLLANILFWSWNSADGPHRRILSLFRPKNLRSLLKNETNPRAIIFPPMSTPIYSFPVSCNMKFYVFTRLQYLA